MDSELAKQKGYWDSQVDGFDSIYTHGKSRFSNWVDATFRWDMYARFDYTLRQAEPIQGRSFLDVGCGTGKYALALARRGAGRVVGIDISDKMIQVCQARASEEHLDERCTFVTIDPLQFQPETTFDVSIGIGLFDYVREPLPMLVKMRELTRDRAILSLPRLWTWRAPVRKIRLALRGCPVYFYSRGRIEALLRQAGFARYEMEQIGQLYCVTARVR